MLRTTLCISIFLASTLPCNAQAKPNTLTPKEIADGWILLFDGETTFGWQTERGQATVAKGVLDLHDGQMNCTTAFPPMELQFEYMSAKGWDPLESTCRHASLSIL